MFTVKNGKKVLIVNEYIKDIIFRKESYFLVAERKYVQTEIGKNPTKWLESNEQDPFRIGKDMTERKMPVFRKAKKNTA